MKQLVFQIKNHNTNYYECLNSLTVPTSKGDFEVRPYMKIFSVEGAQNADVGMFLHEVSVDLSTREITKKKYKKDTEKDFRVPTDLINLIVNLEACIMNYMRNIDPFELSAGSFTISFDENKAYARYTNLTERALEYLNKYEELGLKIEIVKLNQAVVRLNLLAKFKDELETAILENEHSIQSCLKKYKSLISLVLPYIDSTLEFEFRILNDELDENIVDIADSAVNKARNLIELKQASQELFNKHRTYRKNTYALKSEFSKAIQQTNIQRAGIRLSSTNKFDMLSKSTLLIGNKKWEFDDHEDKENLYYNFEVVKYNNKDCYIMSYDEILDRISTLIAIYKTEKNDFEEQTI